MKRELLLSPLGLPCTPPPWGVLAAVDLASGEIVWRTPSARSTARPWACRAWAAPS